MSCGFGAGRVGVRGYVSRVKGERNTDQLGEVSKKTIPVTDALTGPAGDNGATA
jgi:hypothetical protein